MGKAATKTLHPSNFVWAVFLEMANRGKTEFPISRVDWHKAFYDAREEFGKRLPEFDVLKTINPYVHDLEEGIHYAILCGHLSSIICSSHGGNTYRLENLDGLRRVQSEFSRPQQELLGEFARYVVDRVNSK
ncbi:MAG TPA: hypothetical protein VMC80_00490 [Patescibacteria group bacterium]|nr:hypothetical protein [Patescibacteria group bacterium]